MSDRRPTQLDSVFLKISNLQAELARNTAELRELRRTLPDDPFKAQRIYCDDCIQALRDKADSFKCGLGHADIFFKVPDSYQDLHDSPPNWGWFRFQRCDDFVEAS